MRRGPLAAGSGRRARASACSSGRPQEHEGRTRADVHFASTAAAVEEGRRVYDNLIKALAFVLPMTTGLAVILFSAVTFFPLVDGEPL